MPPAVKSRTITPPIVSDIISNVINRGDEAIFEYALKFDKADLKSLEVTAEEIDEAFSLVDQQFVNIIKEAAENINDKASLDEFNLQLKIAKEQVKQLKAGLKGQNSLDTVAAAEKALLALPDKLDVLRQKLKAFGDVEGTDAV